MTDNCGYNRDIPKRECSLSDNPMRSWTADTGPLCDKHHKEFWEEEEMTPKNRMQKFMEIAREKGFLDMLSQMNKEELELMVKSLVPDDKKEGLHFHA